MAVALLCLIASSIGCEGANNAGGDLTPNATDASSTLDAAAGDIPDSDSPTSVTSLTLCSPCADSSQCQGVGTASAACVAYGDAGSFCGQACVTSSDCPADYSCAEGFSAAGVSVKQCVKQNGGVLGECTCSGWAKAQGIPTSCTATSIDAWGTKATCAGIRYCGAAGLSDCFSTAPEVCDGIDNDCDGVVDEGCDSACASSIPKGCDDHNPCTKDICHPAKSSCEFVAESGWSCPLSGCMAGVCAAGVCVASTAFQPTGTSCSDGDACTQGDTCKLGKCLGGAPVSCVSSGGCSTGACVADKGCVHAVGSTEAMLPCDDGNGCTTSDGCYAAGCRGSPPIDDYMVGCTTHQGCMEGTCSTVSSGGGPPICAPYGALSGDCIDEFTCLGGTCANGFCAASPGGVVQACDDNNPCTADTCFSGGCQHNASASGGPCDDGDLCTGVDICFKGVCAGPPNTAPCDDGNPCSTQDTCVLGTCKGKTDPSKAATSCDDGDPCTNLDACTPQGACVGTKVLCDDGNPCTADTCSTSGSGVTTCVYSQAKATTPCMHPSCAGPGHCVAGTCTAKAGSCPPVKLWGDSFSCVGTDAQAWQALPVAKNPTDAGWRIRLADGGGCAISMWPEQPYGRIEQVQMASGSLTSGPISVPLGKKLHLIFSLVTKACSVTAEVSTDGFKTVTAGLPGGWIGYKSYLKTIDWPLPALTATTLHIRFKAHANLNEGCRIHDVALFSNN